METKTLTDALDNLTNGTTASIGDATNNYTSNYMNSGMNQATNCSPFTWPQYYSSTTYVTHFLTVEKAQNGFIVKKNGLTYIAKTAKEVVKYLVEEKKGK